MIHKEISIQKKGSLKDTRLTTYFLEKSQEYEYGEKRPCVLVCPGGAYRFTSDREAEMIGRETRNRKRDKREKRKGARWLLYAVHWALFY